MHIDRIPFAEVPQFSRRDTAYATGHADFDPFIKYPVRLEAFAEVLRDKANDPVDRPLLVEELLDQYASLPEAERARAQVRKLAESNTWTVITAHQPGLFTGPLYFIYKICSTINLSRQLNIHYPDQHIVPVFIVGGEDHDFAEINHTRIGGQRISWEQATGGSVGALSTDSLKPVLEQLEALIGREYTPGDILRRIRRAYTEYAHYGQATVALVHDLFRETELVVANPSRPAFKRAFLPYMAREIFEQLSQPLIEEAQARIVAAGYKAQAFARDINLFYLQPGRRDRIIYQDGKYSILGETELYTPDAFRKLLHDHPERFSPNVVMRPIFQELIFPNLAYIGGGGEIAYWLERKAQFAAFGLNFPMLIRRNSVLWINRKQVRQLERIQLPYRALFRKADLIIRDYVAHHSHNDLSLNPELAQLASLFNSISLKAKAIDPTLEKAALAEHTRQQKIIEQFESRLRRIEKKAFTEAVSLIRELKEALFPGDGLQERKDNFLNVYLETGPALLDILIEALDPLRPGLIVFQETPS